MYDEIDAAYGENEAIVKKMQLDQAIDKEHIRGQSPEENLARNYNRWAEANGVAQIE